MWNSGLLSERQQVYQRLLSRKSTGLYVAVFAFGLALAAFAWLIFDILYRRMG